jgi:hypothetical protein
MYISNPCTSHLRTKPRCSSRFHLFAAFRRFNMRPLQTCHPHVFLLFALFLPFMYSLYTTCHLHDLLTCTHMHSEHVSSTILCPGSFRRSVIFPPAFLPPSLPPFHRPKFLARYMYDYASASVIASVTAACIMPRLRFVCVAYLLGQWPPPSHYPSQ